MSLRGVVRGRTIELEQDPQLPEDTTVEVELHPIVSDPFWGLLADKPDLIQTLRRIVHERPQQPWRTPDETCSA